MTRTNVEKSTKEGGQFVRSIRSRIEALERDRAQVNLDAKSDEELNAYAKSVEFGSPECWAAVLTKVQRRATTVQVVPDEQELEPQKSSIDWR